MNFLSTLAALALLSPAFCAAHEGAAYSQASALASGADASAVYDAAHAAPGSAVYAGSHGVSASGLTVSTGKKTPGKEIPSVHNDDADEWVAQGGAVAGAGAAFWALTTGALGASATAVLAPAWILFGTVTAVVGAVVAVGLYYGACAIIDAIRRRRAN